MKNKEIIDGLLNTVGDIANILGPDNTMIVVIAGFILTFFFKTYQISKKNQDINKALELAEKTVQRLAKENREWKILFFKDKYKWTDKQIKTFFIKGQFVDASSTRKELEKNSKENTDQKEN